MAREYYAFDRIVYLITWHFGSQCEDIVLPVLVLA